MLHKKKKKTVLLCIFPYCEQNAAEKPNPLHFDDYFLIVILAL